MQPTNCSIFDVVIVSNFNIKTISTILYITYISINTSHPEYRKNFSREKSPRSCDSHCTHRLPTLYFKITMIFLRKLPYQSKGNAFKVIDFHLQN